MDISLLEQALALRAEVGAAGLTSAEPDFAPLIRQMKNNREKPVAPEKGGIVKAPEAPHAERAVEFMRRGAELAAAAAASRAPDGEVMQAARQQRESALVEMLRMASAPLPEFDRAVFDRGLRHDPATAAPAAAAVAEPTSGDATAAALAVAPAPEKKTAKKGARGKDR